MFKIKGLQSYIFPLFICAKILDSQECPYLTFLIEGFPL